MTQSFTSSQVSQRTGLTPRQLQWWDEQGIVVPARQGHRRLYSAEDLAELSILSDLRRRGFSLQRIRRMIGLLRREFGRRLAELLGRRSQLHLLTDGESVFLCDSEHGVVDLLRNAQQPLLAISIGPVLSPSRPTAALPGAPLERVLAKSSELVQVQARPARSAKPMRAGSARQVASKGAPKKDAPKKVAVKTGALKKTQAPKKGSQSVKAGPLSTSRVRWR